ncbi:MAG: dihydroorotase [Bacteroidales bacterium]
MRKIIIQNATIINEGREFIGSVVIEDELIKQIIPGSEIPECIEQGAEVIDATGKWLLPGVIDDQVHFRDPGLTYKGDIHTESRAAIAGGVTSFMDMPNTKPQTTTIEDLNAKFERASEVSMANYTFFFGATNTNIDLIKELDRKRVGGIKVFMGSSTGNMLVDDNNSLARLFAETDILIATHCEKESIIKENIEKYKALYGEDLPIKFHPLIRSAEACYASSAEAVALASKYGTRLHLFHLSTAKELELLESKPLSEKHITGEVCVHHLWFDDRDYEKFGNLIKWNPAIKSENDKLALIEAINNGKIDVVATDHAPHLMEEKQGSCLKAMSGGPLVQHSLVAMLRMAQMGYFPVTKVVEKMSHAPAELFRIEKRGYIRTGYFADLVLVDPNKDWTVTKDNILYKCGWSPFEGYTFKHTVEKTFVNGNLVYNNGTFDDVCHGKELIFN